MSPASKNFFNTSHSPRSSMLRSRCEAQRQQFIAQLTAIEHRLQHADTTLASIRHFFSRPGVIATGAALLFGLKRLRPWPLLSRGWFALTTARRLYRMFKR